MYNNPSPSPEVSIDEINAQVKGFLETGATSYRGEDEGLTVSLWESDGEEVFRVEREVYDHYSCEEWTLAAGGLAKYRRENLFYDSGEITYDGEGGSFILEGEAAQSTLNTLSEKLALLASTEA